jgi:hypothetical protein
LMLERCNDRRRPEHKLAAQHRNAIMANTLPRRLLEIDGSCNIVANVLVGSDGSDGAEMGRATALTL